MLIYVTKYALTNGEIVVCEKAPDQASDEVKYCIVKWPGCMNGTMFLSKPDWHTTLEDAQARCEIMRKAKIKSLEKQLKNMQNLVFHTVEK